MNGKTLSPNDVDRIRVSRSEQNSLALLQAVQERNARSSVVAFIPLEWQAASLAEDVTDDFILGPPGYERVDCQDEQSNPRPAASSDKRVFIVHGHDHPLKSEVEILLTELGLQPVVLHRQTDEGQTLIEKFERNADVGYAIILLTPDDVGCSAAEFTKRLGPPNTELRARQNVIFEFGFFAGRLGRKRVCCIYKTGVVLPSDLSGIVYKEVRNSVEEISYALMKELKAAGMKIK
jgi:predicted nucleotide-binding protein